MFRVQGEHGTAVLQFVDRKIALLERRAHHVDQVPMVREQQDLVVLRELRQRAQDVRRALIVRGDEHVIQDERHAGMRIAPQVQGREPESEIELIGGAVVAVEAAQRAIDVEVGCVEEAHSLLGEFGSHRRASFDEPVHALQFTFRLSPTVVRLTAAPP